MYIFSMLSWWYSGGLRTQFRLQLERLGATLDYFSISLLLRTLFSPYKQISAGRVRGPLPVQLRAFTDRLFSRVIGAVLRSFVIVIGIVWVVLQSILAAVALIGWLLLPVFPIAGVVATAGGWLV